MSNIKAPGRHAFTRTPSGGPLCGTCGGDADGAQHFTESEEFIAAERQKTADMRAEVITRLTSDGRFRVTVERGAYVELEDTVTGYGMIVGT